MQQFQLRTVAHMLIGHGQVPKASSPKKKETDEAITTPSKPKRGGEDKPPTSAEKELPAKRPRRGQIFMLIYVYLCSPFTFSTFF